MEKKNKVFLIVTIICTALVLAVCIFSIINNDNKKVEEETKENNSDIAKFQDEYESLNGLPREGSDNIMIDLDINDNLEVYYKTDEEIVDVLNDEKAIIYFGFEDCPWCRAMLEEFSNALTDNNQELYYLSIKDIRNRFEVEDDEAVETTKGTDAYYDMLDILGDDLPDYIVTDEDDEEYDTDMQRIYAPTIVAIDKGEVIEVFSPGSDYIGDDPYEELSKNQRLNLYEKFDQLIMDFKSNPCETDEAC